MAFYPFSFFFIFFWFRTPLKSLWWRWSYARFVSFYKYAILSHHMHHLFSNYHTGDLKYKCQTNHHTGDLKKSHPVFFFWTQTKSSLKVPKLTYGCTFTHLVVRSEFWGLTISRKLSLQEFIFKLVLQRS